MNRMQDVPDPSPSIWKPLFWILFAALICLSLCYRHHSDELRQALHAARSEIGALEDGHRQALAALASAHAEALESARRNRSECE
ncbi:hypothetical protein [Halochromatium sp.]|uniref:hypothetical protein n=1 Tax=Halochromatium sp. TaxID=2049430 RepID=UPI00397A9034